MRPDIVRFVSVLSRPPRSAPSMPMSFPSTGKWLLRILARDNRFVVGLYRRHMKVISYLGTFDRVFGVPVTTHNWSTMATVATVLDNSTTDAELARPLGDRLREQAVQPHRREQEQPSQPSIDSTQAKTRRSSKAVGAGAQLLGQTAREVDRHRRIDPRAPPPQHVA